MAATLFGQFLPRFDVLLPTLSKKGLQRVLQQLIKVPLVDVHFKMDKNESQFAALAQAMLDSKMIMVAAVMNEQFEASEKAKNNKMGEVVNG